MQQYQVHTQTAGRALSTNKVLRNTYWLLGMTLAFSAAMAFVSMSMGLPYPGALITIVGFYGLLFLTAKTSNSGWGILSVFALTGFMGYTLGPILNLYLGAGMGDIVFLALGGTATIFFALSAYVLVSGKDMSFMAGMLQAGFWVLLLMVVAGFFVHATVFHLVLSGLFVFFSSGIILFQTSQIIHGGERNYIMATVTLFVSLYNIFVSLLNILGIMNDD
ncbi:MAG: Bax inhibitor-1/YccA family protein [Pseudomonadota bacterium]|uniref:Bax inhibitor-1/YccA family protein n=1 Tax=Gallaecimonas pentaromativorans TaxID=584787 RepID=UPI00067E996F|nr:Bax inhibitor-1/YccA family protein [Gallaecimonas pentaromativorans]MED5523756.1 Bax inhibitor-1/YccA family protein [Pseudomonadota bacterium]